MQLCLKALVPLLILTGMPSLSLQADNPEQWSKYPFDSHHPAWYALELSIFLGSCCAGALGGLLSKGRYRALAIGLALLSLLTTFFEQFPLNSSTMTLLIWALGPCGGVVAGVTCVRLRVCRT